VKNIFLIIFLSLFIIGKAYSSFEWPAFVTKEIPIEILDKFNNINPKNALELQSSFQEYDLSKPEIQKTLMKVLIQTLNANVQMGQFEVTKSELRVLESLLKKYL
jgi:hypothetical protein